MHAKYLWVVLFATLLTAAVEGRRVNVKPAASNDAEDDSLSQQTTAADDDPPFRPVLVARRPLHQRPTTDVETERQPVVVIRQAPRLLQQRPLEDEDDNDDQQAPQVNIRQQPVKTQQHQRAQPPAQQSIQQRFKEQSQPQQQKETAQTIRNYNKLNDDGSFTFGYEADDGSFKEETRGTDCVVRGKYGYVDPDGNKREFSYVQGNPCDPNAVSAEDDDEQPGKPGAPAEEENVPANVPRPKPKKNRPTTTLFQQTFGDFEQPQPQPQPSTTPRQPGRQQQPFDGPTRRPPPQISSPLTDSPFSADPVSFSTGSIPSPTPPALPFRPSASVDNLESAIRSLPQPPLSGKSQLIPAGPNSPLAYTTELVFDPATGQYNTVIFQQVPKQSAGINISQRTPLIAPTRPPPQLQFQPQPQFQTQFQPHSPPQFQPQPQFRPALQPFQSSPQFDFQRPSPAQQQQLVQQNLVQQQQATMFQQSQNLFRQQQKQQQQQQQQQIPFQPQSAQFFPPPPSQRFAAAPPQFAPKQRFEPQPEAHQQQFVLVQPGRTPSQQSLAAGQIDAFLRGHNVQF